MTQHEYELVQHEYFKNLNVFLVRMFSREPHLHRDFELGFVLDGRLEVIVGGRKDVLEAGDAFLINPMDVHEFHAGEQGALLLAVQASYKVMNQFLSAPIIPRFLKTGGLGFFRKEQEAAYRLLWVTGVRLALTCYEPEPDPFGSFLQLSQLLTCLIRYVPFARQEENDYLPMKRKADRMMSILDYIDENYRRKLLLEEIAEREGVTLAYLSHFFKETMGVSFQEFLKRKRQEEASRLLLTTDRKLLDIALSCGFSDVRYMTEAFVEQTGMKPREYRRQNAGYPAEGFVSFGNTEERFPPEKAAAILRRHLETLLLEGQEDLRRAVWALADSGQGAERRE